MHRPFDTANFGSQGSQTLLYMSKRSSWWFLPQAARRHADARVGQVQAMLADVEAAAAQLAQEAIREAQRGHQQLQAEVQLLVRLLDKARVGQQQAEVGVPDSCADCSTRLCGTVLTFSTMCAKMVQALLPAGILTK